MKNVNESKEMQVLSSEEIEVVAGGSMARWMEFYLYMGGIDGWTLPNGESLPT